MTDTTNTSQLRSRCADHLSEASRRAGQLSAFVGLDGFVDEILHVVDKRTGAETFDRVPTIERLSERVAEAAGQSTNIELVNQITKLGGNGPIMANALGRFGLKVIYLGNLGYPNLHPVFEEFARHAEVHSIAEPGHTDALEFDDGKVMLGKHSSLKEINWTNILERYGREPFAEKFERSDLVAFLNWTMLPHMSDIWEMLLRELCPRLDGSRRTMFFDLADPEKRTVEDLARALNLIARFERHFNVVLGLNEKEAGEVAKALDLQHKTGNADTLSELALEVRAALSIDTVVIHPVSLALAASGDHVDMVEGPYTARPKIATGAGDHFNAGFCLGRLLGLDNPMSLLTGVAASGFYVRTAKSPDIGELSGFLRNWPAE